jgi:predicted RNase H-like nuclease (RuvC/YqgF family)
MKTPDELRKLADEFDEKKRQNEEQEKNRREQEKNRRDEIASQKAVELTPMVIDELEKAIKEEKLEKDFYGRAFKYKPKYIHNPKFEPEQGWSIELCHTEAFSIKLAEELNKLGFNAISMDDGTSKPATYCVKIII